MKKIVVIVLSVFLLTGCFSNKTNQEDGTKRIYLTSSYYNKGEFIKVDDLTTLEMILIYYLLTTTFVI